MQVTATAKYAQLSPRKARLILQGIAGMDVEKALVTLRFTPKPGARIVTKVLEAAVANAENNYDLTRDSLRVANAYAGDARRLKRFKPRARGRVGQVVRRTCHITVIVSNDGE